MKNKVYRYLVKLRRNYLMRKIIKYYEHSKDPEIQEIIEVIRKNKELNIFNYYFCEKYENMNVDVEYDTETDMFFVRENGRRLYFKRGMKEEEIRRYYRGICIEQDEHSPHKYISEDVFVEEGDVLLDLGGAEGNFVFQNIDKISRAIIVECDKDWVIALKQTFKDCPNVIVLEKMIAKKTNEKNICIDDIYDKYGEIDFIKMDIEGAEQEALLGAEKVLETPVKLSICTYHKQNDYTIISKLLEKYNYTINHSDGYMTLHWSWNYCKPYIRRGLIRAKK